MHLLSEMPAPLQQYPAIEAGLHESFSNPPVPGFECVVSEWKQSLAMDKVTPGCEISELTVAVHSDVVK